MLFSPKTCFIHSEYCFLSLWLDTSHPLQGLFRKWGPAKRCLFLWCHGKVQCLFAIWYTWQCCDSINIPFAAIYSSRGNHHGLWWTIIHGWGPFSFPRWVGVWLGVCVCLCVSVCVVSTEGLVFYNTQLRLFVSHTLERSSFSSVCVCLSHSHTRPHFECTCLLFNSNTHAHIAGARHHCLCLVRCSANCTLSQHPLLQPGDEANDELCVVPNVEKGSQSLVVAFGEMTWHALKTSCPSLGVLLYFFSPFCIITSDYYACLFTYLACYFKSSTYNGYDLICNTNASASLTYL